MKLLVQCSLILSVFLTLTACGGDYDNNALVTVELVGGGNAQVTGSGINCPGVCEKELTFTAAETRSIIRSTRRLDLAVNTDANNQFLKWVLYPGFTVDPGPDNNCGENTQCRVLVESYCGQAQMPFIPICQANYVDDVEVRSVVVKRDAIIDWSHSYGAICVLYKTGQAQCWNHGARPGRRPLEVATPAQFQNPTLISNAADYFCVLDQTGVHCLSEPGQPVVLEPTVEFGLPYPEMIASIGYATCQLANQQVDCWNHRSESNNPQRPEVPSLTAPTNLRFDGKTSICVDDGNETVCWLWSKDEVLVTRTPLL